MNTQLIETAHARRIIRDAPAIARDLRRQSGLTQAEVGRYLGVTAATVQRWETGQRIPRGDLGARYLDLLRRAAGSE